MKLAPLYFLGTLCVSAALTGQTAAPASPPSVLERVPAPDTVVAVIDGSPITYSQVQAFLTAIPAQNRSSVTKDPESFLRQFGLLTKLAQMAEEQKLDQQSPYKEQLAYQRATLLSTAGLNALSQSIRVDGAEASAYYEAHKDELTEYATKVIYLPFSNALLKPGETRKTMTESDALALAQKLVKDLRGGADFVAMVKEYSQDEASKNRNGDFGKLKTTDNIPPEIRSVIFSLKPGEVSDPLRQPNGFYIFRMESVEVPEYLGVAARINNKLHEEKFRKKMDELRDDIDVRDVRADLIK
jgi:peptidyl-prolyl cis-trans isomerase C